MPRPLPPRPLATEDNIAAHVAALRREKRMSHAGLAQRMTDEGCPIQASAIYKIESGTPRRRVHATELVAFSRVFGVPLEDLTENPAVTARRDLLEGLRQYRAIESRLHGVAQKWKQLDEQRETLLAQMRGWAQVPEAREALEAEIKRDDTFERFGEHADGMRKQALIYFSGNGDDEHREAT